MENIEVSSLNYKNKIDDTNNAITNTVCKALEDIGYNLPLGMFDTAGEALVDFFSTSEDVDNYYKNNAPLLYKDYKTRTPGNRKPWEVLSVLVFGVNAWLRQDVLTFDKDYLISYDDVIKDKLSSGNILLFSYRLNEDTTTLVYSKSATIQDSNWHEQSSISVAYDDGSFTLDEIDFIKLIKPFDYKKKWTIIVEKPTMVI